jgi:hypothetical protein
VDRCVLILQRDGKIRVEGNREILHAMIEAYATVVREKKTPTSPTAGDEVEKT